MRSCSEIWVSAIGAGAAGSDDRDPYHLGDSAGQIQLKPFAGAVSIHGVDDDFANTQVFCNGDLYMVNCVSSPCSGKYFVGNRRREQPTKVL